MKVCSLLGDDSSTWSRHSPLPPPAWFSASLDYFAQSYQLLAQGQTKAALEALAKTRESEIRDFFVQHGQQSAYFRFQGVPKSIATKRVVGTKAPRMNSKIELEILSRDKHCCRYCGIGVIRKEVFKAYSPRIGEINFPMGKSNATRHGVILGFRAVADHVVPYSEGGATDASNLVTSCWSCNYGKSNCTVAELGLDDPRDREPVGIPGWVGLTELQHYSLSDTSSVSLKSSEYSRLTSERDR